MSLLFSPILRKPVLPGKQQTGLHRHRNWLCRLKFRISKLEVALGNLGADHHAISTDKQADICWHKLKADALICRIIWWLFPMGELVVVLGDPARDNFFSKSVSFIKWEKLLLIDYVMSYK